MDMSNVAVRLQRRFGSGTRPELRMNLYKRLENLVTECGSSAYATICEVAQDAGSKENPGRYFAKVVMLRLKERGFIALTEF